MGAKTNIDSKILSLYRQISKNCSQNSKKEEMELLKEAFHLANENCRKIPPVHDKPYILKVMEVSLIVSEEFALGTTSVISVFLYEQLNRGLISKEEITKNFGNKIYEICESLCKISEIQSEKTPKQAENLRNLILTLGKDVRVILVKIAERIYNLRNLDGRDQDYAIKISSVIK